MVDNEIMQFMYIKARAVSILCPAMFIFTGGGGGVPRSKCRTVGPKSSHAARALVRVFFRDLFSSGSWSNAQSAPPSDVPIHLLGEVF